jgi:SAM-dependent methyltransferase
MPEEATPDPQLSTAWRDPRIPTAQRAVVEMELRQMVMGQPPLVFSQLAEAVRATSCEHGTIVEVGCASGYYAEVLAHLLGHDVRYLGLDYSAALIAEARRRYQARPFLIGDATALPLAGDVCDVLISGCVLLHVADFQRAIVESSRASRRWVIFHRTPVVNGPTLQYTKLAYGVRCLEWAFGEAELLSQFQAAGLRIARTYDIGQNKLPQTGYQGYNRTYLCEKMA